MTTYAKLTEHNEWEGETWHFWIPIEGNEEPLAKIATILVKLEEEEEPSFELSLTPVPESEVDALIKHTDVGYMAVWNKLVGRLVLSPETLTRLKCADPESRDELYKGGIRDFMEPVK